jgi:hypothetical protein
MPRKYSRRKSTTKRRSTTRQRSKRRPRTTQRGGYGPGAGPIGWAVNPSDLATWPGVSGNASQGGNYLPLSPIATTPGGNVGGVPSNPQMLPPMKGGGSMQGGSMQGGSRAKGRRRHSKHYQQRGKHYQQRGKLYQQRGKLYQQQGGLGWSDFTNVIRGATDGLGHLASTFSGRIPPMSSYSDPLKQPIANSASTHTNVAARTSFPDINRIRAAADNSVTSLY